LGLVKKIMKTNT